MEQSFRDFAIANPGMAKYYAPYNKGLKRVLQKRVLDDDKVFKNNYLIKD